MANFWQNLKAPFYVLAPMAGFTDYAFRSVCKDFGADVLYSEMASATALYYSKNSVDSETLRLVRSNENERPYIVQLFGSVPSHFSAAVKIIEENIRPDGIDINFGCPVKKVAKQGAGAVLMDDKKKAREIIKTTIGSTDLPISIKTRTKAGKTDVLTFLDFVGDLDIKALMIHGRTLVQGFSGDIDTAIIRKSSDYFSGKIIANGGIDSFEIAARILKESAADGLGVARGALGRPWIFEEIAKGRQMRISQEKVFEIIRKHAESAQAEKGDAGIVEMRKHLCWYARGHKNASAIRRKMITVENLADIYSLENDFVHASLLY